MRSARSSVFYRSFCDETTLLDVDGYFEEFRALLPPVDGGNFGECKKSEMEIYAKLLDITPEEAAELNDVTSVRKLQFDGDFEPFEHKLHENDSDFQMKYEMARLTTNEDHGLKSLKKRIQDKDDVSKSSNCKYGTYHWYPVEVFPDIKQNLNPWDFSTLVYCIKVYCPYLSYTTARQRFKLLQEIHMLGDQFLSDLKDTILCTMDYNGITDVSNNVPEDLGALNVEKKETYLSSFIFIENQFFNDTRHSRMRDLSEIVIKWAKEKQIGFFTKGSMECTKLNDVKLRIGRPYVYQHQGDCEHILIISDIRFLNSSDPVKTCNFPRVYAKGRSAGRFCMMCGIAYARWLVTENERLTHDKTYFCSSCFKSYNYIDGKKVGDFKAYEYVDPIAIL